MLGIFWENHDRQYHYTDGIDQETYISECSEKHMRDVFIEDETYRLVLQFFYAGGWASWQETCFLAAASVCVVRRLHGLPQQSLHAFSYMICEGMGVLDIQPPWDDLEKLIRAAETKLLKTVRNLCEAYPTMAHWTRDRIESASPESKIVFRRMIRSLYTGDTALWDLDPKNMEFVAYRLCYFTSLRGLDFDMPQRSMSPEF